MGARDDYPTLAFMEKYYKVEMLTKILDEVNRLRVRNAELEEWYWEQNHGASGGDQCQG